MKLYLSLDEIASRMENVRWHGRYFSTRCVFHDDNEPSMMVFEDGAYCMGCQRRVSLDMLWEKIHGRRCPTPDKFDFFSWKNMPSPEELAYEAHLVLSNFPQQGTYLHQRGVESRIELNELGWIMGWYTIPIFDRAHHFQGLVMRAGPVVQKYNGQRYRTPPHQRELLFCPDWPVLNRNKYAYVVFGMIDALVLATLNLPVVTGTQGQRLSPELLDDLRMPLYVVPDQNEEEQARKLVSDLSWRGHYNPITYPEGLKDPADFAAKNITRNLLAQLAR